MDVLKFSLSLFWMNKRSNLPVPGVERYKARVYGRSLGGIAGSNPAGDVDGCPLCVL